jgi:hypothetical protein
LPALDARGYLRKRCPERGPRETNPLTRRRPSHTATRGLYWPIPISWPSSVLDPVRIPLPPGERLLWYRISAVLGRGRSGFTYLARDLTLEREVVIKECLPEGIAARSEGSVVRPLAAGEELRCAEAVRSFLAAAQGVAIAKGAHLVGMLNA